MSLGVLNVETTVIGSNVCGRKKDRKIEGVRRGRTSEDYTWNGGLQDSVRESMKCFVQSVPGRRFGKNAVRKLKGQPVNPVNPGLTGNGHYTGLCKDKKGK